MGEPSTEPFGTPKRICPRRTERSRNLRNLGETLVKPRWNLGGSLVNLPQPTKLETDLPQRTIESPKAILPRNLYYGWRPQSYCCWWKKTITLKPSEKKTALCSTWGQSYQCWGQKLTPKKSDCSKTPNLGSFLCLVDPYLRVEQSCLQPPKGLLVSDFWCPFSWVLHLAFPSAWLVFLGGGERSIKTNIALFCFAL